MNPDDFYNALPDSELIYTSIFNSTIYGLLLFLILLTPCLFFERKERGLYALLIGAAFILRIAFLGFNEYYQVIDFKKAGNFTLWYYVLFKSEGFAGLFQPNITATFYPQLLFNYPGFELFGASRLNVLLVNSFFSSLAGTAAFIALKKNISFKAGSYALFLFAIYPGSINFSAFGLRDPIIFFLITITVLGLIDFYKNRQAKTILWLLISISILLVMRPELAAFLFLPFIFLTLIHWYTKVKANEKRKVPTSVLLLSLSIGLFVFAAITYLFVIHYYGASTFVTPLEFMNSYVNWRFENHLQFGTPGSNILPPDIYLSLHWFPKWILQALGIILLPFPWLITDIWKFFAFLDSLFLIYLLVKVWKYEKTTAFNQHIIYALFFTFILAVIIAGSIVSNAGNAFRIRLSFAPYLLIAGAIVLSYSRVVSQRFEQFLRHF